MYNKKRKLNTTLIGVRARGINYSLIFSSEEKIKEVVFKSDNVYKRLPSKGIKYMLKLNPQELKNAPDILDYVLIIKDNKNKESTITGKVILKR